MEAAFPQLCILGASAVLLAAIIPLWRRHVPAYIVAFQWQSFALAFVTALVGYMAHIRELYIVAALIVAIRGMLFVRLLRKLQARVGEITELKPLVNIPTSLLIAATLVVIAYAATRPAVLVASSPTRGAMPLAIAVILVSMFTVASRKTAIGQVIGFLMLENGIALLAAVASYGVPLTVELGLFLDALLGFLVMQILVFHIHDAFDTTDVEQLSRLKH